jgi:hypothetical protein
MALSLFNPIPPHPHTHTHTHTHTLAPTQALRDCVGATDLITGYALKEDLLTPSGAQGLVSLLEANPQVRVLVEALAFGTASHSHATSFFASPMHPCALIPSLPPSLPLYLSLSHTHSYSLTHPQVHSLDLHKNTCFGPEACGKLAALLPPHLKHSLSHLNLSRCPIKDAGGCWFMGRKRVEGEWGEALGLFLPSPLLSSHLLLFPPIPPPTLPGMLSLLKSLMFNKRLKELDVSGCCLTDNSLLELNGFFKEVRCRPRISNKHPPLQSQPLSLSLLLARLSLSFFHTHSHITLSPPHHSTPSVPSAYPCITPSERLPARCQPLWKPVLGFGDLQPGQRARRQCG